MPQLYPVLLCGGSGTRLWPLSRKSFPKQFVPLIDNKSLLQLTLERVSLLSQRVICVASEDHRFLVSEAMQAAHVPGTVLPRLAEDVSERDCLPTALNLRRRAAAAERPAM